MQRKESKVLCKMIIVNYKMTIKTLRDCLKCKKKRVKPVLIWKVIKESKAVETSTNKEKQCLDTRTGANWKKTPHV